VGLRLDVGALLQPQSAHPTIQIGTIGLEDAGGLGHVAIGLSQCGSDEMALEVIQSLTEWSAKLNQWRAYR